MRNFADHGGFRIDQISFNGIAGALVAGSSMAILLEGVPALRSAAVFAMLGGVLCGVGLILYRRR